MYDSTVGDIVLRMPWPSATSLSCYPHVLFMILIVDTIRPDFTEA